MSCPYFDPVAPRMPAGDPSTAMLPLGDRWGGVCRALPEQPHRPDDAAAATLCNLGYARETCAHFPASDGPDAVRFTFAAASDASLHLYYVLERDHHPFAHGPLEYALPAGPFAGLPANETLASQARAYVASYLLRKSYERRR